jgi:serine/threonine protein phosphatase 1
MHFPWSGPTRDEISAVAHDLIVRRGLGAYDEAIHISEIARTIGSSKNAKLYRLAADEIKLSFRLAWKNVRKRQTGEALSAVAVEPATRGSVETTRSKRAAISAKTYVVPDLHGRFDLLRLAISNIEQREPGTVVFTGDYIDRGPQSREVIERLIAGPKPGWKWICLAGNHEDMLIDASIDHLKINRWLRNGGDATLISYGLGQDAIADPSLFDLSHLDWTKGLLLFYQDNHRIYVHAGVDQEVPLDKQKKQTLIWKRYRADFKEGYGAFHVVHGHDPFDDGPRLYPGRTDLDTGAYCTGRLFVGVFDDEKPGGPVDLIENVLPRRNTFLGIRTDKQTLGNSIRQPALGGRFHRLSRERGGPRGLRAAPRGGHDHSVDTGSQE